MYIYIHNYISHSAYYIYIYIYKYSISKVYGYLRVENIFIKNLIKLFQCLVSSLIF